MFREGVQTCVVISEGGMTPRLRAEIARAQMRMTDPYEFSLDVAVKLGYGLSIARYDWSFD